MRRQHTNYASKLAFLIKTWGTFDRGLGTRYAVQRCASPRAVPEFPNSSTCLKRIDYMTPCPGKSQIRFLPTWTVRQFPDQIWLSPLQDLILGSWGPRSRGVSELRPISTFFTSYIHPQKKKKKFIGCRVPQDQKGSIHSRKNGFLAYLQSRQRGVYMRKLE
jgi:hypothetical protein